MALKGPQLVALAIGAGIVGWMATGELIEGGQADPNAETIAEREAKLTNTAFRVRVQEVQPSQRTDVLQIRGRTQANATVSVRAETGGTVQSRPVEKGQFVQPGDILCEINKGIRGTNMAQARAVLEQAQEDYDATERLVERGFATKSRLRSLRSALDTAIAAVANAEQDIERTIVRATVAGQVQSPLAQPGDNLSPGGLCVTLLDNNPMLFSGQVPERDIASLTVGKSATISLVSGEKVNGTLRFLSPVADPNTRTFAVEIELPNQNSAIPDGMTAVADIALDPVDAYQLEPSWLTLADDGRIGVRIVGDSNKVMFMPVSIIAQEGGMAWVNGLTPGLKVITLGQNFVSAGEVVEPVTAEQMKALEKARVTEKGNIKS